MGTQLLRNKGEYLYLESPQEQLMELLVEKTRTAGHVLSFQEASQDPEMVNPNSYAFYFGSFGEAAKLAWKKIQNPRRKTNTSSSSIARVTGAAPKPNAPKATITTRQHWEGKTLIVEIEVLKPGTTIPLRITLTV